MSVVAVTDLDWFRNLRRIGAINASFWTPTPWRIRRLAAGDRFYFMLKSPIRRIGGYGLFAGYSEIPVRQAWDEWGRENGMNSVQELVDKVEGIAARRSASFTPNGNPAVGIIRLCDVVFFGDENFIDLDSLGFSFSRQIVKYKYFDADFV